MYNIKLLNNLNDKQRQVVSAVRKNLLVLAGAGSGKTLVLVRRIAWLISIENCCPKSILAVTFTNKAAKEIKMRVSQLIGYKEQQDIWIGTFHGFAYYVLRIHYAKAKLPKNFQIIDNEDQKRLVKRIINIMNLNINKQKHSIEYIIKCINEIKNNCLKNDKKNILNIPIYKIYDEYQKLCEINGVIDFNELIFKLHKLLLNNKDILKIYQNRFQNILIDEFQDTNSIQYNCIYLLYKKNYKVKITIVGDDDQSIYGWRGAKIENINYFLKDFHNVQTILLEQNYRSTSNILNAANKLISNNNSFRLEKKLWTNTNNGKLISIYFALNEFDEAKYIINYIKDNLIKKNIQLDNCVILYRNNSQSRIIEENMLKNNIPYKITGSIRFYERQEIKNTLSYLKLISNYNDDSSFERIINIPKRGIGIITINTIKSIAKKLNLTLWKASNFIINEKKNILSKITFNSLKKFIYLIKLLKKNTINYSLPIKIEEIIKSSGLWNLYLQNNYEKNNTQINNLKELINSAVQFVKYKSNHNINKKDNLIEFLSQTILEYDSKNEQKENKNSNFVQMMTIHSSKGLEFSQVFIIGMEEGIFPNKTSLNNDEYIYEERRLAYVGITRAKKKLILTYTKKRHFYGKEINSLPSRFIHELPNDCIKKISYLDNKKNSTNTFITNNNFYLGQIIYHNIFGKGIILKIEQVKNNKKVKIKFTNIGIKWIMSNYITTYEQ
ncbi:UvrD-helicase domain-containing protein [Enterobacteriaceae endosymbiont of Plateumaris braccata]|uniref:UvrD-helicase domain-containing protein n=1 Tax=Enterobacteriaceae endosymbiont of Plateumaris braccata TaxID=2675793 RepID=UPI001449B20E|nr:UvrD-helicase domain-containing protein [Enterobacteriaceae endosymbiont of Plateumaris braccata]QJC28161.1 AAA family ATPase [Enterobacteriaceae endosymbiont of Plateumaris braccata]